MAHVLFDITEEGFCELNCSPPPGGDQDVGFTSGELSCDLSLTAVSGVHWPIHLSPCNYRIVVRNENDTNLIYTKVGSTSTVTNKAYDDSLKP